MQTYTSAMNFDLDLNPNVEYRDLYLDVDYQVENSEVAVKSVHSSGHDITPILSEDNHLAIAQLREPLFLQWRSRNIAKSRIIALPGS